jgi:hypothetical protein
LCIAANSVACGEMRPAMVGFCLVVRCTGYTLMPFVAVVLVAYNVQRFPKAREPTVRAAKGFPPPLPSIHFHRPRWQGAQRRRGKRVLADVEFSGRIDLLSTLSHGLPSCAVNQRSRPRWTHSYRSRRGALRPVSNLL